ncbi:MAG: hypothetical protein IM331_04860 [Microcystis sp. M038S1]|uniref:hypothetical protein n=1 Tax=unclassified Microcystis TaxID=2643300 RepID=UPI0025888B2D|nr:MULTISPECIES: hypothetical protein [unclassified Microcystis]MCA2620369.1 hypothetical protein [Microcystis sp. M099S2]MCA2809380.1 hypothetical protein [Microcystis sp. M095S1]MCA2825066.1 hypothetical protein [Microcystis sp. M088S1]MCA2830722.1 hypothetical protein [Microcystis sp. M086S1]MCA2865736.1 hypothetical protein [Microcystis sp. M049S1]MCA2915646.1 hypothetical protein [Microcystis sp. M022S1]MCA2928128.1 hypothetical protein [Microcystis sp. M020S1]
MCGSIKLPRSFWAIAAAKTPKSRTILLPSLTLIIVDIKYRLFFLHRSSHN